MADDSLGTYRARRRSGKSPEPDGRGSASSKPPIFVIQEHQASTHHFDFRIELEGVLKSWRCRRGRRPTRVTDGSLLRWRTTRWIAPISKA
jgi:hypothetical protein